MSTFTRLPRTQLLIGIAAIIVVAELFANVVGNTDDEEGSVAGWLGLSLFGIAVAAVLVLVVVPRLRGEQRRTAVLGFGIAAAATCLVFWSALPFALGAGALAAAAPGDDSPEGDAPAPSTAGVLLALLAIAVAFVLCIMG